MLAGKRVGFSMFLYSDQMICPNIVDDIQYSNNIIPISPRIDHNTILFSPWEYKGLNTRNTFKVHTEHYKSCPEAIISLYSFKQLLNCWKFLHAEWISRSQTENKQNSMAFTFSFIERSSWPRNMSFPNLREGRPQYKHDLVNVWYTSGICDQSSWGNSSGLSVKLGKGSHFFQIEV